MQMRTIPSSGLPGNPLRRFRLWLILACAMSVARGQATPFADVIDQADSHFNWSGTSTPGADRRGPRL
ncbi:MAG: hypothetical protein ABIP42_04040, partial [Planctomycetota bacterium]